MAAPDANIDRLVALGAAIDAAPMCLFVADAEMRYIAVNAYACELRGYAEEELLRMRVSDIAAYDEAPQEYDTMIVSAYLSGTSRIGARTARRSRCGTSPVRSTTTAGPSTSPSARRSFRTRCETAPSGPDDQSTQRTTTVPSSSSGSRQQSVTA
jgi:PAS domain S-box-containing protein